MFNLDNKIAVVIGGAGGLGEHCALALSKQGAKVVIASRNLEKLQQVAGKIQAETKNEVSAMQVDVADEDSVNKLADAIVKKYGTVDILVNSQGLNIKMPALEINVNNWDAMFSVSVKGVMIPSKVFGKIMVEKKKGKIINLSSIRGARGTAGGNTGYGATKGAVDMITRMMAAEWAPFGVNVNAIGPALVLTETIQKEVAPERIKLAAEKSPMKRLGVPSDIEGACVFLASDEADFITGQILYVDGGVTAVG